MAKYFLGALTPCGFVSHFQNIIEYSEGNRLFILKGGSGIGKSTFLKKIKSRLSQKGMSCDEFFCSNAPDSLDGILCPSAHIAVVDGTNPHVVEPRCYGIFDRIVNLGEAVKNAPSSLLPKIKAIQQAKSDYNAGFVSALVSSQSFYLDTHRIYNDNIDASASQKIAQELVSRFEATGKTPKLNKTFIAALTLDGYKSFLTEVPYKTCICLSEGFLSVNSAVLTVLASELAKRGYSLTAFCNNFEPNLYQGLFVEDTETLIYSTSFLDTTLLKNAESIDMNALFPLTLAQQKSVEENLALMNVILPHCYENARRAAALHDELEALFYPYVDFSVNDRLLEEFFDRLDC